MIIVAIVGMLLVVRIVLMFDIEKMVRYFHQSAAAVTARDECQAEHVQGEYVDSDFHQAAKIKTKLVPRNCI